MCFHDHPRAVVKICKISVHQFPIHLLCVLLHTHYLNKLFSFFSKEMLHALILGVHFLYFQGITIANLVL